MIQCLCSIHAAEKEEVTPLINQVLSSSIVFYVSSHQLLFTERGPSETASLRNSLHKRGQSHTQGEPLSVELLEDASGDCERPPSAPLITCEISSHREMVEVSVPVNVVGVFLLDSSLSTVAGALKSAIAAQLRATRETFFWRVRGGGRLILSLKLPPVLLVLDPGLFVLN